MDMKRRKRKRSSKAASPARFPLMRKPLLALPPRQPELTAGLVLVTSSLPLLK
jgi:hypothetical protein